MDKFKLAHTTKPPKVVKPIQKPKPKHFQKKIKELLTGTPVSSSDTRQDKSKKNAVKFLTNEAGGDVKDRSIILPLFKKKKSKASKKKVKDRAYTNSSKDINNELVKFRKIGENITNTLHKEHVGSPKKDLCSLKSAKYAVKEAELNSFSKTNASKHVKQHTKKILDSPKKKLKYPKIDSFPQGSIAQNISHKHSPKTSNDKAKEDMLSIKRNENRITAVEECLTAKEAIKKKPHKNKQKNISPTLLETKDAQSENPIDPNKNTDNKKDSRQKVNEIGHLHRKKAPTFVCKKSLFSKGEDLRPNPLLKIKKKTTKDKITFKETKQEIISKEEGIDSSSAVQESKWTSALPSSDASFILAANTVSSDKIKKKNRKKKRKKKKKKEIQPMSASNIDISLGRVVDYPSELNNNITLKESVDVSRPIVKNKDITQKKKAFKKKREALPSVSENTHLESTVPEISEVDTLLQSAHFQPEKAAASCGFNVEVIDIDDSECSISKGAGLKIHKKSKENDNAVKELKTSRGVSSPRSVAEQDSAKKLKGKRTKQLKENLSPKEKTLEAYGGFIVDIEEPNEQPHSSGEQQLSSVVNVVNEVELPSVLNIFPNAVNIPSPEEGREIHSVIQEFIPDVSEAQSTFSKAINKKNRTSQKQTAANDTRIDTALTTEYRSKSRKRKLNGEDKYLESINTQQEESTKNKIPSEPLVISAAGNIESFQVPAVLDAKTYEPCVSKENIADIHSVVQFLLGSQEKDSFFESSLCSNTEPQGINETPKTGQVPAFHIENLNNISNTNVPELKKPIKANSVSPVRNKKLSENADETMESTVEKEYTEVFQELDQDDSSVIKQNVSEPLLIEMTDIELPPVLEIFNRFSKESISAPEEVHSNSLIEHFIPTSLQDEHLEENHPTAVVSTVNDIYANKRKKKESYTKQQKKLDKEIDDVAKAEENSVKFYSISSNSSRFLLFMKYPSLLYFKGKLTIAVLSGIIEVLGSVLKGGENFKHVIYSPKGSSLMSLQTCESDENEIVNYVALMEKLAKIGMDASVIQDILTNLGQRDCLVILEEGPTVNLEELVKRLPTDMHLFDISNENRKEWNPTSCLYQAQKKLGCIFELPNSAKSFRRYSKNPQWDALVRDIISCNVENLKNGPVSTVVCGGKGVGKSTFLRYLVNKCIIEFGRVLWLDFDPGQAEFVMPGCVAAVIIEEPLLGPNFTHLKKAERMVFVGDVNISQCPIQYLQSVRHVVNYCRFHPELKRIPWLVNTMGFCKGLGIDLTSSIIRLLNPHKVVQIQSESYKRNFPQLLSPEYVAGYPSMWRSGPAPGSVTLNYDMHVISTMTDSKFAENTRQWGMEPRRLREIMILSYLSQVVEPPGYSLFDIVPYATSFHKLTLCICHRPVQYAHMLSAMNGNLVALCYYDGNEALVPNDPELPKVLSHHPVCPCLGFGIVRGIDTQEKNLFLITPVPEQDLRYVNCLMMGAIMLPAYLYTTAESGMGQVPYVSAGPGQPTSKVIRRFFRPLEEKTVHKE